MPFPPAKLFCGSNSVTVCTQDFTFLYFFLNFFPRITIIYSASNAKFFCHRIYMIKIQCSYIRKSTPFTTLTRQICNNLFLSKLLNHALSFARSLPILITILSIVFLHEPFSFNRITCFTLRVQPSSFLVLEVKLAWFFFYLTNRARSH